MEVGAGELCAVMGENGCGKSTLLRLICGFIKPDSGRLCLSDADPSHLSPKARARQVAYLPQRFGVYFDTDVLDVVLMGSHPELHSLQSPTKAHRRLAQAALEHLHISHLARRSFAELSEGQKQLVMIARCMIQKAPLLLFDEPDSALDINNRHLMMETLSALVHESKKGALLVLHDQQLALSYCDKIYLMRDGAVCGMIRKEDATAVSAEEELRKTFSSVRVRAIDGEFFMGYAKDVQQ